MTETVLTMAGSFVFAVIAMLITNAISSGWRTNKITEPLQVAISGLREIMSSNYRDLHSKIDKETDDLRMRIDGGVRVIDDKIDDHSRDDNSRFDLAKEQVIANERWTRDNCLLEKHFDLKMTQVLGRLDTQDRIADARHQSTAASINESKTQLSDMKDRITDLERTTRNGKH